MFSFVCDWRMFWCVRMGFGGLFWGGWVSLGYGLLFCVGLGYWVVWFWFDWW